MNIYIVKASCGQYDDYREWNIAAFLSESAAKDFIEEQGEVNYSALSNLDELKWDYIELLDKEGYDSWTDEQWQSYNKLRINAAERALKEVQAKYPFANLTVDVDFNGYSIEELEVKQ